MSPEYIREMLKPTVTNYDLRSTNQLAMSKTRTKTYGLRTFSHLGASLWNKLPKNVQESKSISSFKQNVSKVCLVKLQKQYYE